MTGVIKPEDIALFQTIQVNSEGSQPVSFPVDERGKKEDIDFGQEATMFLITGIRKRYSELMSNNRARPQVYRELHEEFIRHGYNFSLERIRRKWNNLLGTYKRVKKEFSPKKPPWEYYQILSEFLPPEGSIISNPVIHTVSGGGVYGDSGEGDGGGDRTSGVVTVHLPTPPLARQLDQGTSRQSILHQYIQHLSTTQDFLHHYRRRKERRERLKLRALRKIGKELKIIAKTQSDILKKQDKILRAMNLASKD